MRGNCDQSRQFAILANSDVYTRDPAIAMPYDRWTFKVMGGDHMFNVFC
jgi:hypothetical protein